MDKKTFNRITKEVFLEYGFKKEKNKFILYLDDVTLVVRLASWRCVLSFDYYLSINALFDESTPVVERFNSWEEHFVYSPSLQGYHRHEILYEEYSEDEYRTRLNERLHAHFDLLKEDSVYFMTKTDFRYHLLNPARDYLNLIDYETGKRLFFESDGCPRNYFFAKREEYHLLGIPPEKEAEWRAELDNLKITQGTVSVKT